MTNRTGILAVMDDLFFLVKIQEAAKRMGVPVAVAKTEDEALDKAKQNPALIILDLNAKALHPLKLIQTYKSDEATRPVHLVGFVSHVQIELRKEAEEAGCDEVLARSAFSQNLPAILARCMHF